MGRLDWAQISFAACVMVNMVDVMGMIFTAPVMVPYGQQIGATTAQIASFSTIRFGMAVVSLLWMPRLADRRGVKMCILISVVGTAIAYAIQGNSHRLAGCDRATYELTQGQDFMLWEGHDCRVAAGGDQVTIFLGDATRPASAVSRVSGGALDCVSQCDNQAGVYFMLAGRALAGFFGGTQPVLRGYVATISMPDMSLLKLRTTILFASMQAGNFALAPIAGVISQFGLFWPWYVAAAVAVLTLVFAAFFFKNPDQLARAAAAGSDQEAGQKSAAPPAYSGPKPLGDKVLWVMLLAYYCIFQAVSAILLLLPLLLEFDDFDLLNPLDEEGSRERLASATSLTMVPHGVTNLGMSTVGFLLISSKIGDRNCLRVGGVLTSSLLCVYGFASTRFWHLVALHGCAGLGIGLIVPALSPSLARYNQLAHSSNISQAGALPMFGMQLGQIVGPMLFGLIVGEEKDRTRMNLAWLVVGISFFLGVVFGDITFAMIQRHPVSKRLQMSSEQLKTMLETNAKDQDEFVEETCRLVRRMLTPGTADYRGLRLWSGVAQRFVTRVISNSIPKLREDPQEHLEDVADWVVRVGTEQDVEYLLERFPQLRKRLRPADQEDYFTGDQLISRQPSTGTSASRKVSEEGTETS